MNSMKQLITVFALTLAGCSNTEESPDVEVLPQELSVTLDYNFFESGSMTRSGDGLYQEFYNKYVKTKILTPTTYEITFRSINNKDSIIVRGYWNQKNIFKIREGEYNIKGISHPNIGNSILSGDTVSICFNENVTIGKETTSISLEAKYDSFLLLFDPDNIKEIRWGKFTPVVKFKKVNEAFYSFFNSKESILIMKDPLYITRNNGAISELWIHKFNLEYGNFYYFKDINGRFEIPPMDNGNIIQ